MIAVEIVAVLTRAAAAVAELGTPFPTIGMGQQPEELVREVAATPRAQLVVYVYPEREITIVVAVLNLSGVRVTFASLERKTTSADVDTTFAEVLP